MTVKPCLTAFGPIPDFARGHVRDLRIRWALEEVGQAYDTHLFSAFEPRPESYKDWQPFGQVPAYRDEGLEMFETGAILLRLGESDERLLPREPHARWRAISWLFAALNSVEPYLSELVVIGVFFGEQDWSQAALEPHEEMARSKLDDLSTSLRENEWLAGQFTIADIAMVTVLRLLDHTDMLGQWPNLSAYRQRGMDRPAFARAMRGQMDDFDKQPSVEGAQQTMEGA